MKVRTTLRIVATLAMSVAVLAASAGTASAGPPEAVFDSNDRTWFCTSDGFPAPPTHCLNIRSKGKTGLLMVFPPDNRGPAESISGPNADDRPCPHDPGSPDGTWWQVPTGAFVCHHKP